MSSTREIHLSLLTEASWITFGTCRFERRTFVPYPCLASAPDAHGQVYSKPYRGKSYDPAILTLIPGGWDHEHCDACNDAIEDGDDYWTNNGPAHVDLCLTCYPVIMKELHSRRASGNQ